MTTKKPPKKTKSETINFEKSLEKLNLLVEKMERGNLALEQSLQYYEEGITLVRQCQKALANAEQKIEILTNQNGKATVKPYEQLENTNDD